MDLLIISKKQFLHCWDEIMTDARKGTIKKAKL